MKVAKMKISIFDNLEDIVGKGEKLASSIHHLFLQCFQNPSPLGSFYNDIVWLRVEAKLKKKMPKDIETRKRTKSYE